MCITAVIVTYNPTASFCTNIAALAGQVDTIVIVDNASDASSTTIINSATAPFTNISLIKNDANFGLARALNQGVRMALSQGATWVLTLDQDSLPSKGMVPKMLHGYRKISKRHNLQIGILVPTYVDYSTATKLRVRPESGHKPNGYQLLKTAMTSGCLVSKDTYLKIGLYDPQLFVDYVDHEFCLRCRSNDLRIAQLDSVTLQHSLGNMRETYFMGIKIQATHHTLGRRREITKNRIYVYKKWGASDPQWVLRDVSALIWETIKIVLVEKGKWGKIKCIFHELIRAGLPSSVAGKSSSKSH